MRVPDSQHTPRPSLSLQAAAVFVVVALITVPSIRAQAPPGPAAGERTLEFRVVDARTGKPLSAVKLRYGIDNERIDSTTDDTGRCMIRQIPRRVARSVVVWVEQKGYASKTIEWHNESANSGLPASFTLRLVPAITIGGVIQDEAGKPIAGAIVYVRADSQSDNGGAVEYTNVFDYPARTDAEGRWTCDRIPEDVRHVETRLVHLDYASDNAYTDTPEPPLDQLRNRTAVMVMKRGATISGTVRDGNGKPIAGARMKLGIDRWGLPARPLTRTDAEGRYRLQVEPGSHVLTVVAEGYSPDLRRLAAVQRSEQADFTLGPGRIVQGRFVDPEGRPIAGVSVSPDTWRGCRTLEDQRLKADADGRFRWASAPADEVLFDMGKGGYMWIRKRPFTASDLELTITLAPLLEVQGKVVDAETDQPLEAFQVIPGITISERPYWMYDRAVTAKDGRYEITFDDPRSPSVRIEAVGYHPAESRKFKSDEGKQVFDFTLRKAALVAGKERTAAGVVRLPDGAPLAGAEVVLVMPAAVPTINNGRITQRGRSPIVKTAADGRFALPVPEEDYAIVVLHDRGIAERTAEQLAAEPVVTVQPWGRIEGLLKVGARPGARQSIHITREHAPPGLAAEPWYFSSDRTDDEGRFALDRVPPGAYRLDPMMNLPRGMFTASGHGVDVEVKPGAVLEVTIGGTGRPVAGRFVLPKGANIAVDWSYADSRIEGAQRFRFNVGPDGSFRVEDVPAGKYRVSTSVPWPPSGNQPVYKLLGEVTHAFELPEMPGGRSDDPLDLGAVELNLH